MLGIGLSESTVAKYMIRHRKPPSQTWKTFLENHAADLVSIDFFTVPTATFRVLYHDRFNSQIREQSWPFLMSVASIMSTDAQLDFSYGRTVRRRKIRVSSVDAMLCRCSQAIIGITRICGAEDDAYVCKNIGHSSRAIFLVTCRSEVLADRVFGRDNRFDKLAE